MSAIDVVGGIRFLLGPDGDGGEWAAGRGRAGAGRRADRPTANVRHSNRRMRRPDRPGAAGRAWVASSTVAYPGMAGGNRPGRGETAAPPRRAPTGRRRHQDRESTHDLECVCWDAMPEVKTARHVEY